MKRISGCAGKYVLACFKVMRNMNLSLISTSVSLMISLRLINIDPFYTLKSACQAADTLLEALTLAFYGHMGTSLRRRIHGNAHKQSSAVDDKAALSLDWRTAS